MSRCFVAGVGFLLSAVAAVNVASAASIGFVEDFPTDHSYWLNSPGTGGSALVTHQASGGPDGSSYASGTYNFVNNEPGVGGSAIVFRGKEVVEGEPSTQASGGNLFGNWINDEISDISMMVRHDATDPITGAPLALNFFARLATPANHPAAVIIKPVPVIAGEWTELRFSVRRFHNPFLILEGPPTFQFYNSVFSDIGRVQLGVSVPDALGHVDQVVTFDIDKVRMIPEPSTIALLGVGLVALGFVRQRRARLQS
ncbi:PEP-CTERM sorting domain-containing protein [Aeoliella sp.]|uniref:PEP-CTERM sorting domain-containing protein n=1 Tax=Aeoliella sp. TaxID=2795800 RepID=UPI003CCC15D7